MDIGCLALVSILIGTERYCIVEDEMRHRPNRLMGNISCFDSGKQEKKICHRLRADMDQMH